MAKRESDWQKRLFQNRFYKETLTRIDPLHHRETLMHRFVVFAFLLPFFASCTRIPGFGYIDTTGRVVIPGLFDRAYGFSNGLARVSVEHKYGFIDRAGKFIVKPQFFNAQDFSEGLAVVDARVDSKDLNTKGYVDKSGNIAIKPQFLIAADFSEGLAWVEIALSKNIDSNWKSGYIDKTGNWVIKTQVGDVGDFDGPYKEGLAAVVKMPERKWGYMDKSGKFVIPPKYDKAYDFHEGFARVVSGGQTGFINRAGNFVVQPIYETVRWPRRDFSDGLAAVRTNDKWGYVDNAGKEVIKPQFDQSSDFTEGLAVVNIGAKEHFDAVVPSLGGGNTWVINKTGDKVEMPGVPAVNWARFSEGLLPVCVKGTWGYMDKTGKMVIAPQYAFPGDFHEGLAAVVR